MTTCNTCGGELKRNKAGVMYCPACAKRRGKSSRAKGNRGQREAAAYLTEHGLYTLNTGIAQRRMADKSVPDLSSYPRWPDKSVLLAGEEKSWASLPAWLWGRGPKRKPSLLWWEWLEGVRCLECGGDGGWVASCEGCDNTGWLSHRHDFAMIRRTARRGEAAYDWLVMTQKWGPHTLPGWDRAIDETLHILFHPRAATEEHNSIVVIPADKWARAVKEQ